MKISGRNLKQRLYGLRNIPSNIKRARYFRGHGVHSPYIYAIVREVFMTSKLKTNEHPLYDELIKRGIARKRAIQLQNLVLHCKYEHVAIDCPPEQFSDKDMVIITTDIEATMLSSLAVAAQQHGTTLCVISPSLNRERDNECKALVEQHSSTSVDNRGYLLLFNNHLPKQVFRL